MKQVIFAICILLPSLLFARTEFYPNQVEHIFLNPLDEEAKKYEVLVEKKDGALYRLDSVQFTSTREKFFRDIAYVINRNRYFKSFDYRDVARSIWGMTPFATDDIIDIRTLFEEGKLTVYLDFETGDVFSASKKLEKKFSSSHEVTQLVADIINEINDLEGTITTEEVALLHEEAYTGLSYFSPTIESLVFSYNKDDNVFNAELVFEEEDDVRAFALDYLSSKEALLEEATSIINDQFVEYEDAHFELDDIVRKAQWEGVPWMIDDIEELTYKESDDDIVTIEYTVRTRLSSGLVGVSILATGEEVDVNDIDAVALEAARLLEENQLFAPEFSVDLVKEKIQSTTASIDEYNKSKEEGEEVIVQEESTLSEDSQRFKDQNKEAYNKVLYVLLLQMIIHYVEENNLDIDLSSFTD